MKASVAALVSALLLASGALAQKSEPIAPADVGADHLGKEIVVEGRVYTIGESNSGIHLYFGADTSTTFQGIVLASELHKFKVDVKKKFSKRNVRVTGEVEEQDGKYYIRIREPRQLKVVPRRRATSR